jgi:hypothetical protein
MTSKICLSARLIVATLSTFWLNGCGPNVNSVHLQFEKDFAGLLVIRAKSEAANSFSGQLLVPMRGEMEVAEKDFYGDFQITATRWDGIRFEVKLLSSSAPGDTYALWQLPDGAYIRYFFLGRRDEMERFYQLNKERLYQVEESRLKRSGNSVELNTGKP